MGSFLQSVLDWSEAWAAFVVVCMLLWKPRQPTVLKPVVWYAWLAFIINLSGNLNWRFQDSFPEWLQTNNPLYNFHSIIRFICFSTFFFRLPGKTYMGIKRLVVGVWVLFLIIDFGFVENFFDKNWLSGNLLATEAFLLLVYCMLYYLAALKNDSDVIAGGPVFWVITGLSIYVVINFFLFLFYRPLLKVDVDLSVSLWNIHNIAFIILSIFLSKAFYGTVRNEHRV